MDKPHSAESPWKRLGVIVVALALGVFAFPGGMVEWLDNHNTSGWLNAPLALTRAVDDVSAALGVKAVGQALRGQFAKFAGDDES
jgi:hypothetical protein